MTDKYDEMARNEWNKVALRGHDHASFAAALRQAAADEREICAAIADDAACGDCCGSARKRGDGECGCYHDSLGAMTDSIVPIDVAAMRENAKVDLDLDSLSVTQFTLRKSSRNVLALADAYEAQAKQLAEAQAEIARLKSRDKRNVDTSGMDQLFGFTEEDRREIDAIAAEDTRELIASQHEQIGQLRARLAAVETERDAYRLSLRAIAGASESSFTRADLISEAASVLSRSWT